MNKHRTYKTDLIGWIIITAFIFTGLGYTWRYGQEQGIKERSYQEAIKEMDILVKEELCQ